MRVYLLLILLGTFCKPAAKQEWELVNGPITLGMPVYYVHTEKAVVYTDSTEKSKILKTLKPLDSVCLEIPAIVLLDEWYKVFFESGDSGYMKGNQLANPCFANVDVEPGQELLLYGYENYKSCEFDSEARNNGAFVKLFKDGKLVNEYKFKAYNDLDLSIIEEMGFEPEINLIQLSYGLEACDYPSGLQLLYVDDKNVIRKIHETEDISTDYAGLMSEFAFPIDTSGSPNQLKVYTSLLYSNPEPGDTSRYDTTIYNYKLTGFSKVYETKNIAKQH